MSAATFRVWDAAVPAELDAWTEEWAAWPGREVFAHPAYGALFAQPGDRVLCAFWEEDSARVLHPVLLRDLGQARARSGIGGPAAPALGLSQFVGVGHRAGREVAGRHLGVDLDPRVGRNQRVRNVHPLADLDARAGDGVVLHVAHRHQAVDLADAQPVQHVGHQLLEAHVLHAGHAFGAGEVLVGGVAAHLALAGVVDQELGHLAERAALLARVRHQADPAALRALDALLDRMRQVGPAGADVGAEHVGAVALVVHAGGELDLGVGQVARVAEDVDGLPADGRQEHLEVASA